MIAMVPIDQLPIPDWGLKCPKCGAPLAGARSHRCRQCGQPFNIWQVVSLHRPILDIGLECPNCSYTLTGLTESRCPECGMAFSLRTLLDEEQDMAPGSTAITGWADPPDCHIPKRAPAFTGRERPLPNFGLMCLHCDQPLAGADADRCPGCGNIFDLADFMGNRDWVVINHYVPRSLALGARGVLYDNQVPYLVDNARLVVLYYVPFAGGGIRVPRDFFFDALHAIEHAKEPPCNYASEPWFCPSCGEEVPQGFEVCWNCGGEHPMADSAESAEEEER